MINAYTVWCFATSGPLFFRVERVKRAGVGPSIEVGLIGELFDRMSGFNLIIERQDKSQGKKTFQHADFVAFSIGRNTYGHVGRNTHRNWGRT